jgi:protocatechuate 3,4-dioxygenase beta subunit
MVIRARGHFEVGRRRFLRLLFASPLAWWLVEHIRGLDEAAAAEALRVAAASGKPLEPTPDCGDDDEPTPSETAGPFYKPRSPKRTSLIETGIEGTPLELTGRVFGRDCRPLAGALVDFWHADDDGIYDNEGYRLRGHQFADDDGRYRLSTIMPGLYPGRTRHIHVRVQPPGGRVLTTQLYFPDEPRNRRDGLFRDALLVTMEPAKDPRRAYFHFVLAAS